MKPYLSLNMQWHTPLVANTANVHTPIHNTNIIKVNIIYFLWFGSSFDNFVLVALFQMKVGTIITAESKDIAIMSWPIPCPYFPNE